MMRGLLIAALASAAAVPATAAADNTPPGPATVMSVYTGVHTLEGAIWPGVLVGAKVTVAAGGEGGMVRIRARLGENVAVGPAAFLPAEPGTYVLPAPHIRADLAHFTAFGIDQETGGHAIVQVLSDCPPELGPEKGA